MVAQHGRRVLRALSGACAGLQGGVAVQPRLAVRPLLGDDDGGVHVLVVEQGGLDLAGLDAVAADLDLVVGPADVLELAAGGEPGEVAALVEALAGPVGEGVGDEPVGGLPRVAEVAARQAGAADVQLSRDADGYGLEQVVEGVQLHVGHGPADGAAPVEPYVLGGHLADGDVDGLRDAVHVDQARGPVAVPLEPAREDAGLQCLAAEDDDAQREVVRVVPGVDGGEVDEGGGGLVEDGDALLADHGVVRLGVAGGLLRHDDEPAAVQQGSPHLDDGDVEGVAVEHRPDVVLVEVVRGGGLHGREHPGHRGVGDLHSLGRAGGSRGVDDVCGVVGRERRRVPRGHGAGRVGEGLLGPVEDQEVAVVRGQGLAQ